MSVVHCLGFALALRQAFRPCISLGPTCTCLYRQPAGVLLHAGMGGGMAWWYYLPCVPVSLILHVALE